MRELYPSKQVPEDLPLGRDLAVIDNRRGEELLREAGFKGFHGLRETVFENLMDQA
jgi:hypothetical protein